MSDFDLPPSVRSAIVWGVIWVVATLVFGGGVGSLVGGIAKGALQESGVDIGKAIVDGGKALGKRLSDSNKTKAMYAKRSNDGRPWCGIDPNHETYCCNDANRRLVIEYWGNQSPYSGYGGIQFRRVCY